MSAILMVVPLAEGQADAWREFAAELNGPRRRDLDEMERRHGLKQHRSWIHQARDGHFDVLVMLEGDHPEDFVRRARASKHPFDQYFVERIKTLHGIDFTAPLDVAEPGHSSASVAREERRTAPS